MSKTPPHLKIEGISKSFSNLPSSEKVLKNISFEISAGTIAGIIGKSGAGKSTLLRCLNGLERADQGRILFEGYDLMQTNESSLRQIRRKIGIIFQSYNLLSRRTIFENIALPLELVKIPATEKSEKIHKIAGLVGLSEKLNAYPSELSGGQRQRVAIARALVAEPSLLLCDEFTSALDPQTTLEILNLLHSLNQTLGITIILVTHDITVVKEIAKEVYVLDQGNIVESGPVTAVLPSPKHPITQSLLAELFKDTLPAFIQERLHTTFQEGDDILIKLIFDNQSSTQPLISTLVKEWQIPINIISGNLEHIEHETFGHLTISWRHDPQTSSNMIEFLGNNHVEAKTIGFLRWQ